MNTDSDLTWLDRETFKPRISRALSRGSSLHISLNCDAEIKHVENWLRDYAHSSSMELAISREDCGLEIRTCSILSEISKQLGFVNFSELFEIINLKTEDLLARCTPSLAMNQSIADNIKSFGGNEVSGATQIQKVFIKNFALIGRNGALEVLYAETTESFFCGLSRLSNRPLLLIVSIYGQGGLGASSSKDFKSWFWNTFVDRLNSFANIQVCILDQSVDPSPCMRLGLDRLQIPGHIEEPEYAKVCRKTVGEEGVKHVIGTLRASKLSTINYQTLCSILENIT